MADQQHEKETPELISSLDPATRAAVEKVSPGVRRALAEQHKATARLNKLMAEIETEHPGYGDWPPEKIVFYFPQLPKLMATAAKADIRAVRAVRQAAHKLQNTRGIALPVLAPPPSIDLHSARCEGCGCSWLRPCAGGCGWSSKYAAMQRAVCTNCFEVLNASPPPRA